MAITPEEQEVVRQAQVYKNEPLTRSETELWILRRKLTDEEWNSLNKFKPAEKQPKKLQKRKVKNYLRKK